MLLMLKKLKESFFETRFTEPHRCKPGLDNLEFNKLDEMDRQALEEKFLEE